MTGWEGQDDVVGLTVMVRPPPERGRTHVLWFHADDQTCAADPPRTNIQSYVVEQEQHMDPWPPQSPVWAHLVYRHTGHVDTNRRFGVPVAQTVEPDDHDEHLIAWFDARGQYHTREIPWRADWWVRDFEADENDPTSSRISIDVHPHAYDPVEAADVARAFVEREVLNRPIGAARRIAEQRMMEVLTTGMGVPSQWLRSEDVSFSASNMHDRSTLTAAAASVLDRMLAQGGGRPSVEAAASDYLRARLEDDEAERRRDRILGTLDTPEDQ